MLYMVEYLPFMLTHFLILLVIKQLALALVTSSGNVM